MNKKAKNNNVAVKPNKRGRPKGALNKTTATIKQAIIDAFNEVGGAAYLVAVAKEDPKTFLTIVGKVLPMQIAGPDDENGNPTSITVQLVKSDG